MEGFLPDGLLYKLYGAYLCIDGKKPIKKEEFFKNVNM